MERQATASEQRFKQPFRRLTTTNDQQMTSDRPTNQQKNAQMPFDARQLHIVSGKMLANIPSTAEFKLRYDFGARF